MDTIERFSYEEYLDRALNGKGNEGLKRSSRVVTDERNRWAGASWNDAARMAKEGWEEGRGMVGNIARDLESRMDIVRPEVRYDVEGDCVDVGAFVSGEPECVMRWEDSPHSARVVRILFNITVSAGVTCEAMRWKGACVVALIDKLEAEGVRVELDMVWACVNYSGDTHMFIVRLKEAGEPLHLDLMAFHLAHPASFRRVFFSFAESASQQIVKRFGFHEDANYGTPMRGEVLKRALGESASEYGLIVPELHLYHVKEAIAAVQSMFDTVCAEKLTYDSDTEEDKARSLQALRKMREAAERGELNM